ncbi:MAG: 50S ribosomal protein L23 [Candidatus Thermoplasmatota archaeon]|nr:50S ribosomal protein L23 [Candidatus Thermoplasmatota archaeon]
MIEKMPHTILLHPYVTEKTLNLMEKEELNSLVFIVKEGSTKPEIRKAFEDLFEVKVQSVNVKHTRFGKMAIIKLTGDYSAEDVGMRIGIF